MISLIFFFSSFLCRSLLSIPVGWKQHAREPCKELHATKQHPLTSPHLPLHSAPAPCGPEGVFHQRTWLKGQDVLQQSARWCIHTGQGTWRGATWQHWRGGAQPWVRGCWHGIAQGRKERGQVVPSYKSLSHAPSPHKADWLSWLQLGQAKGTDPHPLPTPDVVPAALHGL